MTTEERNNQRASQLKAFGTAVKNLTEHALGQIKVTYNKSMGQYEVESTNSSTGAFYAMDTIMLAKAMQCNCFLKAEGGKVILLVY